MQSGLLKETISVYTKALTTSSMGGQKTKLSLLFSCRAQIPKESLRQKMERYALDDRTIKHFKIRYDKRMGELQDKIIIYEGKQYQIEQIDHDRSDRTALLICVDYESADIV